MITNKCSDQKIHGKVLLKFYSKYTLTAVKTLVKPFKEIKGLNIDNNNFLDHGIIN